MGTEWEAARTGSDKSWLYSFLCPSNTEKPSAAFHGRAVAKKWRHTEHLSRGPTQQSLLFLISSPATKDKRWPLASPPLNSHLVPFLAAEQCVDKGCGVLTPSQEGTPCRRHIQVIPAITAAPPTACSLLLHPLNHFTCRGGGGGGGFVAWHDHHLWGTLHFQVFAALWKCSRSCFKAPDVSNGLLFPPQIS